ncbi:MAG TPA: sigma-54 dependent transcriptional regulator [Polyangiaceae bacterium]|nr:sigma-54 dependent transcriptional regulator [Polyangiaceae bacterium]
MIRLRWRGSAPEAAWQIELERAGAALASASAGAEGGLLVVRTSGKEPPKPPPHGPWLWLSTTAPSTEQVARAVLAGAVDVLDTGDARLVEKLLARAAEASVPEPALPASLGFVAHSEQAQRVLRDVLRAAKTSMPVLLTGETGTGKELVARLVHTWSRRESKLFVPINCAAIPNDLIESELFGYARGAFSGAVRDYDGLLLAAEGGSVFLDEIDDTPPTLQTKLLRVLEDKVVSRLGQNAWRHVDFRIIASTNRDLEALIARGEFAQDLYERLAILHVRLPALRERPDDLPALAQHFIERYYAEEPPVKGQARVLSVSPRALVALQQYGWPGNVRELRNAIYESLVRKLSGDELLLSDLPRRILERTRALPAERALFEPTELSARFDAQRMNLKQELENLERAALSEALRRTGGNPTRAARLLGEVGRGTARDPAGTVRAMMRRLGITGSQA